MAKEILNGTEAKKAIKTGVDIAADLIKVTLGPTGKAVILDRGFGSPVISDDGVTVAKEIELENKFQNVGASLIQEVANRTNEEAGDGTTTATVLAQKMIEQAFKTVEQYPKKSSDLKKGMDKAVKFVVSKLASIKEEVKTKEKIEQVATISSLDPEVGKLIAEAMEEVGTDGVITVEEGQAIGLEKEVVKGMRFDKGFVSGYMVTNAERMEAVWEDPYILITDKKISAVQDIIPVIEKVAQAGRRDMVIIADDIEGEALALFVVNKLKGTFNVLAVKSPGFGDRKKEMLQDIAVLTGGQVISEDLGLKLDAVTLEQLGKARKVIATKEHTTLVDGQGDKKAIEDRVGQIKNELKNSTSEYEKEKLQERMARLSGGVGVIKVGAFTETEMKAKKFKIEDALNATKAAVQEGIVSGGGAALAWIAPELEKEINRGDMFSQFEREGASIVRASLEQPLRQIADNTDAEAAGIISYVQQGSGRRGYDFSKYTRENWEAGKVEDMLQAGIVDPLKVTRLALENAVSIASTLVTTEGIVVDKPEKKEHSHGAPDMGMGGMGY
ncbi:MAG TPA: chaperonin GroEL [Candidatus Binatia bacterium]|nr:chaperonin GroEL [Candidatus Binatia bacterium]